MSKGTRTKVRKRRKRLFVDRFGGKCQVCGYDKCINSLVFHHLNPKDKEYSPTELMNFSIERAEKELDKCIMICANCHGEIHSEDYNYEIDPLKFAKDWIEVTCNFCGIRFKTKHDAQKFCTDKCSHMSQRKVQNRPSKDELQLLIQEYNWTELGRMFKISDNAIRRWAKNYNLI